MRCIANVLLKQKAKCILKNVEILIQKSGPMYKSIDDFEICISKFYSSFIFEKRDIKVALEGYNDIFEKYGVIDIVPKRMLLLIFENVTDYLDIIEEPILFNWYYLLSKLLLVNILVEEYSNSLTDKRYSLDYIIRRLKKKYRVIFDAEVEDLFNKCYNKILKNLTNNNKNTKRCLSELKKSPLRVKYDLMGEFDNKVHYISKIVFDERVFDGIDLRHVSDSFQKYGFANDFKYIEAENVSYEIIKNVFANKTDKLYFIKLPDDFFRLNTRIKKLNNVINQDSKKYYVFLVPYEELLLRDVKVKEFKNLGYTIGVYNMNKVESKSVKLKGIVDYVYFRPSLVTDYNGIVNFARSIDTQIIENEKNSYKMYK